MSIIPPIEDGFEATLQQKLTASASALTIYVSKVPVATLSVGREVCMTINPKKGFTRQENVLIESWDSVNKTLTIKVGGRAQKRYNGDSYLPIEHPVGSKIIITDPYPVWELIEEKADKTGDTFTGTIDFSGNGIIKLPNLTTAQRDALPSPSNGMKIYNTTVGEEQTYNGGSWVTVASGGVFPNASETVAGKVEQATLAEQIAKTETGTTNAPLFVNPKQISFSSSDAAQGKLVGLNASSKVDSTLIDVSGSLISLPAGEAVDGSTTPQLVFISDGTNGKTSGRFYKADADDFTNMATRPVGFVTTNASSVGTSYNVLIGGVVSGFSGLTVGAIYYMSATAGGITATTPTSAVVQAIGRAISATQLLIEKGEKRIYASYAYTANATGTTDTTITIGFKPLLIFASIVVSGKGSTGSWFNNETSFSLENKGSVDLSTAASTQELLGDASNNLLYYTGQVNSGVGAGPTDYITQTINVNAVTANSITIRRSVTRTGAGSDSSTVRLIIIGN